MKMAEDRKRPRYQDPTVASKLKARRPRPHPPPFQKAFSTHVPNKSHQHPHHQSTSSMHQQQSYNHFSKPNNVTNQDYFSKHQVHRNQLTTITTSTVSTTTYSKSYQYQQEPKFIKHNKDVLIMQLPTSDSGQAWSWSSPSPRSMEGTTFDFLNDIDGDMQNCIGHISCIHNIGSNASFQYFWFHEKK